MSAEAAMASADSRGLPVRREPLIPSGVLGMLIFIFTEVMFFAGLISAHTIVRSQAVGEMWPPYGQPRLPVEQTALNSLALLVSGVVLVFAWFAFKRNANAARIPLLLATVLGLAFVGLQGMEWSALLTEGLTLQSSTYGGFFYVIVGAHAIHALGAILGLVWAFKRLDEGVLTSSQLATVSALWYFVVLVWPVLYWKVYL